MKNKKSKSTTTTKRTHNFPAVNFPNFSNLAFLLHFQNPPTTRNRIHLFSLLFAGILYPANVLLQKVLLISTWRVTVLQEQEFLLLIRTSEQFRKDLKKEKGRTSKL